MIYKKNVMIRYYCKGNGVTKDMKQGDAITPKTFMRRAYQMVKDPQYILIHYFDEKDLK